MEFESNRNFYPASLQVPFGFLGFTDCNRSEMYQLARTLELLFSTIFLSFHAIINSEKGQ